MQQITPAIPFAWAWWGFDLGDIRPCDGTYCHYPIETLPPIPPLDGTLMSRDNKVGHWTIKSATGQ